MLNSKFFNNFAPIMTSTVGNVCARRHKRDQNAIHDDNQTSWTAAAADKQTATAIKPQEEGGRSRAEGNSIKKQ